MDIRRTCAVMRNFFIFHLFLCVSPFVFADEDVRPDEGVILISVQAHLSTAPKSEGRNSGVWIKNLKTGKSYGSSHETLILKSVPEGIYCVDEIELFPRGTGDAFYCRKPYIKIIRGRLNNAGQWHFEINQRFGQINLESSLDDFEITLEKAKKKYPEYFE